MLERFSMAESYPQHTPMESGLKITRSADGTDNTEFRAMIGALSFLARNTRPDIAFAVNLLSRIQNCSTDTDKNYVRRIFRYLKGTVNFSLLFSSTGCKLEAYIDASYAPDATEDNPTVDINFGRSVSGYLVRLFGDPIIWGVKKQSIVASSSTAAELIAIHDALDDVRVAKFVMFEIFGVNDPVVVFEDNTSTTKILMGGEQKKVRSILIKCYDTLEAVAAKEITLQSVPSVDQLADLLTKALDREKFDHLRNRILFPLPT